MLLRCIQAENRELRRSVIWLLFLAVPAISAVYGTFNYNMNLGILKRPHQFCAALSLLSRHSRPFTCRPYRKTNWPCWYSSSLEIMRALWSSSVIRSLWKRSFSA